MTHLTLLSAALSGALAAAIWQGALLAGLVALALRLLPGISAAARSAIWTAVFVLLLALHFTAPHAAATGAATHPLHVSPLWSIALATLWLTLSFLRATQFAAGALRLRATRRNATPVATAPGAPFLAPLSRALGRNAINVGSAINVGAGTARAYTVCTSPDVDRPSVLGFFAPQILLPEGLVEALSPDELQQVLLHETEHLRRADDWINLLQKLALVLFPLNPVLFWVERRLCLERELACDDRVLAAAPLASRKSYATCLTRIAEQSMLQRGLSLALGALGDWGSHSWSTARQSELATRVYRLLRRPERSMSPRATRFAAAALLFASAACSVELAHTPRLITFAPAASAFATASNAGAARLAAETWEPHPAAFPAAHAVLAKAILPPAPAQSKFHVRRAIAPQHLGTPRILRTVFEADQPAPAAQPRLIVRFAQAEAYQSTQLQPIEFHSTQVQPVFQTAIAVMRTPDGWLVIPL